MNITILVKLVLAHIIGDFFLQTDGIAQGKFSKGISRYGFLAVHSLTNAAMAYLLVADWHNWLIPTVVFVTHFLIDSIKVMLAKDNLWVFLVDQLAHLTVIYLLWRWVTGTEGCPIIEQLSDVRVWVVALCYLLLLKPTSILLSLFIGKWTPANNERNSLPNAGKWIGYLERTLILTFVLVGCMEGIGFLLAAKSIFRFGELTKAREVKITEYVMIGTLSSFAVAILVGAIALKIIS